MTPTNLTSPRIVYMGTPTFAVEPLRAILSAGYNVAAVVTAPDKPVGRGLVLQPSAMKQFATEQGIAVLQPDKLRSEEFMAQLKHINPDIAVVVAFRMLPEAVWTLPRLGTFNLHASLLPNYRGAAPINWAIINGEKKTGLTTFLLNREIDTGSIILQQEVDIHEADTAGDLHDRLMHAGAPLVVETINLLLNGQAKPIEQSELLRSNAELKPAPKIFKHTCQINWSNKASAIHNLVRGLSPYPAALAEMRITRGGKAETIGLKIFRTQAENCNHNMKAGAIATDCKKWLKVACSDGYIAIEQLQQSGKKPLPIEEFLRGWQNTEFIEMTGID